MCKFSEIRRSLGVFTIIAVICFLPLNSFAIQTVTLSESASPFIEISHKDLNLLKFPFPDVKVYTNSTDIDIKIHGGDVFINVLSESVIITDPISIFIVTSSGTYSMMLVPKFIPAETIIVKIDKQDIEEAAFWERSHDYITRIKEVIKAMYKEVPPTGFKVVKTKNQLSKWKELSMVKDKVYLGASLTGERYEAVNLTSGNIRLSESEFYEEGVLAVSIDRHELLPSQSTHIYIVKKSSHQRRLEESLYRSNPLDVLRAEEQQSTVKSQQTEGRNENRATE
jgi:conjugal transfer pilus assembly protein TraK